MMLAEVDPEIILNAWRGSPHTYGREVSRGRWRAYRYQRFIARIITPLLLAGNARIIVNAGPRVGKSELISVWTPMWWLDRHPHDRIMIGCYGQDLATKYGRSIRNWMEQSPLCLTKLSDDSKSAHAWNTPEGGGLLATSIGGPATGFGYNLGILDDTLKNMQDAYSYRTRQMQIEWFQSVFYQRREPGASIIVCMHRMHEDDICGWLQREHSDDWTVIRLPSLAEENDPIGRALGEALCPERFDVPALEATRLGSGSAVWNAMHQQRPDDGRNDRVYQHFNSATNVDATVAIRMDLPLCLSFDFNINPGMHVEIGHWDQAADLLTEVDEIHGPRMSVRAALEALDRWLANNYPRRLPPEIHLFGDATGKSESIQTGESCWSLVTGWCHRKGFTWRQRVPKANPPVIDSINATNEAMRDMEGKVHYRIHPRCVRLIEDFRNLRTDESGAIDKHESALSHASDAARYRVHYLRPIRSPKRTFESRIYTAPV